MDSPVAIPDLHALLERQRAAWRARVPDYRQRSDDLKRLRAALKRRLGDFATAMSADFGRRSRHESLLTDGMPVLAEIDHVARHLRRWMKPSRRAVNWLFLPARAAVRCQPLGVVGVIAPWNYPVNLALMPLIAAIAAGNHVLLKPSEHTPRTSELLGELLAGVFPAERVATVLGGPDVAAAFAALPLDHLFFTGSTAIGRKVMAAAAANLTPVTLELGGKSPAIIAPGYPIERAAERIGFGKFLNAGQTCIAPDYVLLPESARDGFVAAMRAYVEACYPQLSDTPDYTSIVNAAQFDRLQSLAAEAAQRGARVVALAGETDRERRILAPTVVLDAPEDTRLMREEIFGPILPLVTYRTLDDALAYVNARPRPLALYHFDEDRARTERVLAATVAGGVSINDCILHIAQDNLPFGGVGPSGMGHYHGHAGFLAFSKQMPVFYQARLSSMALFRPPYGRLADFLAKFLTR